MQEKGEDLPLRVYTLGRFEVYRGDEQIHASSWKWRKAKNMLLLLLLAPNHRMLKEKMLEWLWPEHESDRASNNMHRTLFVLRRILQPDLGKAGIYHYVSFEENCLILNSDAVAFIDYLEFEKLIQLGCRQGNNLEQFKEAYALYRGEFLPDDLYEAWTIPKRNDLEASYLQLIKHLARGYKKLTEYTKAIEFYQLLVDLDSIDEEVHRELMRLYTQVGQRHHALQLYKRLSEELSTSFQTTPSPETSILYDAILNHRIQMTEIEAVLPTVAPPPQLSLTTRQTTIIGRDVEKQQLHEFLQQTKLGQGTVVLIGGEAGIGKTYLVEQTAKQSQKLGFQVVYGRIYEQEGSLPYSPFTEIIREHLTPQLQELLASQYRSLFQALAYLLPELGDSAPQNPSMAAMGQARQHLFDAITLVFSRLAREAPLFFVLEDVHLAGESTLQLLHYLARHITNAPILLVCTIREEAMRRGHPINKFHFGLQSNQLGHRLHLQRLSREDTELLCMALVGDTVSKELLEAIYQHTEGNPFFVRELVLALIQNRQITLRDNVWQLNTLAELPIPANIQMVIGLRLEQSRPEAYQLAEMAAVVGEEVEHELLQLVTNWPNEKIFDLLNDLFRLGIIKESGEGYRFNHALIRQFIYNNLTVKRRAWAHEKIARALEDFYPHDRSEQIAKLAHHYECAQRDSKAFHYLVKAGDCAQAAYASQEALNYYNRAMNLNPKYLEQDSYGLVPGLLERRVQSYLSLSDFEAAIIDLEQLLEIHRKTKAQASEGETLYQLSIAHYWAHRLGKAGDFLDQAIILAQSNHFQELLAKAFRLRDILSSTQGKMDNIGKLDHAEVEGTLVVLSIEEHWGRAMLAHLHCNFSLAVYHAQSCIKLGEQFFNNFLVLGGRFILGMSYGNLGDYQLALTTLLEAIQLSEMVGDHFWKARLLNTIGWIYRELFDLENAIHFDTLSLEFARMSSLGLTEAEGNALANLAEDYFLAEDYQKASAYVEEGLTSSNEPFMRWRYQNRLLIIKGLLDLVNGDPTSALEHADEALDIARRTQVPKNIARSCHLRGLVFEAIGEPSKARKALTHALDVSQSLNSPSLVWSYYFDLATFEDRQGAHEVASEYYKQAGENLRQVLDLIADPKLSKFFRETKSVQLVLNKLET